jgi:hypothetical protein
MFLHGILKYTDVDVVIAKKSETIFHMAAHDDYLFCREFHDFRVLSSGR